MKLTPGDVRSLVVECLKRERPFNPGALPFQVSHLFKEVAELCKSRGRFTANGNPAWLDNRDGAALHPHVQVLVWSTVWDLIIEGCLRPGADEREHELPHIHVTEHGKEAFKGNVTPYDPEGFLKEIAARVPTADPVIVQYVAESAETLRRNCLLASTITLGCASEKAFLLLLDAYRDALNPADQSKFVKEIDKVRGVKAQHAVFKRWYETKLSPALKAAKMDTDWLSALDDCLHFIFTYFCDIRNDAGHPTGVIFSRERVHSHLVIFPYYLRIIYDLLEWIDAQKPL